MTEPKLNNYRFPKFSKEDGTAIDMMVDHVKYGTIPITCLKGEELFARASRGDFGSVKPFLKPVLSNEQLTDWANEERLRRVNLAYVSGEKRSSAYGYFAKLASIAPAKLTDDQKKDLATLHAADEWESEMIGRVPIIVAQNSRDAITRDSAWPECPVAQALKELCEQC